MNTFFQLILIVVIAGIIHACMGFAGIEIGVYLSFLLWFFSLGLFVVLLPAILPTG
jgi:hypothetical protein